MVSIIVKKKTLEPPYLFLLTSRVWLNQYFRRRFQKTASWVLTHEFQSVLDVVSNHQPNLLSSLNALNHYLKKDKSIYCLLSHCAPSSRTSVPFSLRGSPPLLLWRDGRLFFVTTGFLWGLTLHIETTDAIWKCDVWSLESLKLFNQTSFRCLNICCF